LPSTCASSAVGTP